jgi:hypothetical protein
MSDGMKTIVTGFAGVSFMVAGIVFSMDGSYKSPLKQTAKHPVFQSKIIPIEKATETKKTTPAISKAKAVKQPTALPQNQPGYKQAVPKVTSLKLKKATSIAWDQVPQRIRSENNLELKIAALKLKKATSVAQIR